MIHHELRQAEGILIISPESPLEASDFESLAREIDPYIEANGKLHGVMIDAHALPWLERPGRHDRSPDICEEPPSEDREARICERQQRALDWAEDCQPFYSGRGEALFSYAAGSCSPLAYEK